MKLTTKLPAVVVGAILLTAVAGSALSIVIGHNALRQRALNDSVHSVMFYASNVQSYVESARSMLTTTAELPLMRSVDGPRRMAALILAHSDVFEYLMLLKPDGTVILLEPHALEGQLSHRDLSFNPWFRAAQRAVAGGAVVSDLHISPATQRPTVVIAVPVRTSDGRMQAIWAGALKLGRLSGIGARGSERAAQGETGYVTDRRGLIIAHRTRPHFVENQTDFSAVPSVRAALAGQEGSGEYVNPVENEQKLAAYVPLPELGWAVVHSVPAAIAVAPLNALTFGILSASLALAALIGAGTFALARRITKPLAQLSQAAQTLGTGDFSRRIETTGNDEIGQLAHEFNRMADSVSEKIADINAHAAELVRSNAELQRSAMHLEAANKELEAFSYSVSHDLRAPLRAVDGFARILNKEYADRFDAEGRRLLGVVSDSAQKMGQLIDDLLAFSRMGRREMVSADIDMTALARDVASELRRLESGRAIEIDITPLPAAHGDPSMIRQVWFNLLSNAIKFTRPRAPAHIEISGRAESAEHIYGVKDNGVGFDMQYVGKLFGVFQRLHGSEEFEGTGVGLALAQRIVHRHGGRIWAEAQLNEGATFSFTLPSKPA